MSRNARIAWLSGLVCGARGIFRREFRSVEASKEQVVMGQENY